MLVEKQKSCQFRNGGTIYYNPSMSAIGIKIASVMRGLALIACAKSCFVPMKNHFLLIFMALLMGFGAVESFAQISSEPIIPVSLGYVNMKIEPRYFAHSPPPTKPAFYTWGNKTPRTLPPGLTLNQLGVLSGMPSKNGTYTFIVVCKNASALVASQSYTVKIETKEFPSITTSGTLIEGTMDVPYVNGTERVIFGAKDGIKFLPTRDKPTGYNWSLSWGKIPTGMTFNTVGALSGIPRLDPKLSGNFTQHQTFTFNITATDAVLGNNTKTFSLKINPPVPPTIVTDCPLPEGLELYPYANVYLKATSGKKEYKWSVGPSTNTVPLNAFNRFPDGLILSSAGTIYSKPTLPGLFVFRLKVTDANGLTAEKECRINIRPAPEICTDKLFECASVGDDAGCFPMCAQGGGLPYTWSATGLPPALTIDSTTGKICGNFTQAGNFTANITVRESFKGNTANKSFPIVVKPKLEITTNSPLPWGIVGRSYPATASLSPVKIEAKGGWPPYKMWKVVLGKLPDGLTLDPVSGIIGGTPILKGSYKFTVQVIDSCGKVALKEFVIDIYDPITLPTPPIPCLTVNKTFSTTLTASGGLNPLSWQLVSSSSPLYTVTSAGPTTATLAGTPSLNGTVSLVVRVTDANTPPYSEDFTLNYSALSEVKITSACPPAECTSGKLIAAVPLTATGGNGNYTWSKHDAVNNPWPTGLDIRDNKIQGTPVLSSNTTNYTIACKVTDSCGNTDNKTCPIIIYPALSYSMSSNLNCLYNGLTLNATQLFSVSGGKPPYSYSPPANLPSNLVLSASGFLSGTINATGNFSISTSITDNLGNSKSANCSLTIYPKLEITTNSTLKDAYFLINYSQNLTVSGGKGPYKWKMTAISPANDEYGNFTLSESGVFQGRSIIKQGQVTFNATIEDACGQTESKSFHLEIKKYCLEELYVVIEYFKGGHGCNYAEFKVFANNDEIGVATTNNSDGSAPNVDYKSWVRYTTCNSTKDSTKISLANTEGIQNGWRVSGVGIASNTTITDVSNGTLSINATQTQNGSLLRFEKTVLLGNCTAAKNSKTITCEIIPVNAVKGMRLLSSDDNEIAPGGAYITSIESANKTIYLSKNASYNGTLSNVVASPPLAFIQPHVFSTESASRYNRIFLTGDDLVNAALQKNGTISIKALCNYGSCHTSGVGTLSIYTGNGTLLESCTVTKNSTEISCSSTAHLLPGMTIRGGGIPDGAIVNEIMDGGKKFVISKKALDSKTGLDCIATGAWSVIGGDFPGNFTINCTINGSKIICSNSTKYLHPGMLISGNGISVASKIVSVSSQNFTVSQNASANSSVVLNVTSGNVSAAKGNLLTLHTASGAEMRLNTPIDVDLGCQVNKDNLILLAESIYAMNNTSIKSVEPRIIASRTLTQSLMVCVPLNSIPLSLNSTELKSNNLIKKSSFKIANFEITNAQYADFLNAIAKTNLKNLYSPLMANIGIHKNSNKGPVSYSVDASLEDYPVAYVSWFDAARYANWMANGKPTGAQSPTTTENGVYNLGASSIVRNAINPNTGKSPTFWLLNESEWYTSAYLKSDATALWAYPTQSNTAPDANGSNPANLANFGSVFGETTPVGFFDQCPGPFGTFDQGGNVREWTESLDTSSGAPMRIIRGGSWADPASSMRADESHVADPTLEDDKTGFRIGGAP